MNSQPAQFKAVNTMNFHPLMPRRLARLCISANKAVNAARTHHNSSESQPKSWNSQDKLTAKAVIPWMKPMVRARVPCWPCSATNKPARPGTTSQPQPSGG